MDHRDSEPIEKRHNRQDERVGIARDKSLCDMHGEHNCAQSQGQPDDGRVEFTCRTEVDERERGRRHNHRKDDEGRLKVAQLGRHLEPQH